MTDHVKPLSSYEHVGRMLAPRLFRHFLVDPEGADMREVFARHPQLVMAFNHGPAAGPILIVAGYLRFIEQIGAGDRRHFGVTWKAFYDLPVVKHLARFITQTEEVMDTADYVRLLREGVYNDFMVAPEGDHCAFGNGFDIQPFVSHGFVEIAVRAGVPILVASHQGSEAWSAELTLPQDAVQSLGRWLPQRWRKQLDRSGILSVPWVPFTPIEAFKLRYDLYQPKVSIEALDAATTKAERAALLEPDAEAVRRIMQAGVERLRELPVTAADRVHPADPRPEGDIDGEDPFHADDLSSDPNEDDLDSPEPDTLQGE
ncbi:MAG: hypothetical protein IPG17_20895 [Sandaracinaceae bacterium]|jgi:hypothetical protein|nr:hypothetical protein [Sandaracinaceae bacterium]MBP7682785.1 hypothetical protein [Deltaproteobacteria bacterium]MBK6810369.1 hypothetical protein [Sandaracinaceae bacterium]MBK7153741.1 hypothetical protein [Sandaracinaceae bacterium]MBK7775240.1 hypothetical protein [Sandaracinaceae bacterium]